VTQPAPARDEGVQKADADTLVIIEDFAFSRGNRAHQLGGLGYLVRHALWKNGIPFILVGPQQRAKFCCGSGNGTKDLIVKYVEKRFGVDTDDHNAADAVTLLFIGQALLGWWQTQTQFQVEVLAKIKDSYHDGARSKVKKSKKKPSDLEEIVTDMRLDQAIALRPARKKRVKAA